MKYCPVNVVVMEIGFPGDAYMLPMQTGVAGDTLHGAITYAFTPVMPIRYMSLAAAVSRYTASGAFITEPPHIDEIVDDRPTVVPVSVPPAAGTTPGSTQVSAASRASIDPSPSAVSPGPSPPGASITGIATQR